MKKFTAMICAVAMSASMAITAVAAPSIGQLIPEAPVLVAGEFPEGYELAVQNADTSAYEVKDVADIVEKFNKDEDDPDYVLVTIQDVMDALTKYQVTDETESEAQTEAQSEGSEKTGIFTTKGNPVDLSEYEPLMPFVDLVITNGVDVRYDLENPVTAKMKVEVAKKFAKEDLLLMQVDPFTGRYYFIELDECDAETGEITAEFPCLGPFTVLAKSEAIAALAAADTEAEIGRASCRERV